MVFRTLHRWQTRRAFAGLIEEKHFAELYHAPSTEWAAFVSVMRPYFPKLFPYSEAEREMALKIKVIIEKELAKGASRQ